MEPFDPVLTWIARLVVAVLFAAAGASKLWHQGAFRTAVEAYDLAPRRVVAPLAAGLAVAELAAALLLLWPASRLAGAVLLWSMLLMFSGAIAINIWRGRTGIDCGCWLFGAQPAEQRQRIGWLTLARNGGLAGLILVATQPALDRPLDLLDWVSMPAGALAALALFAIGAQLRANAQLTPRLRASRP